ncbi:hypothetical protein CFP65_5191 [Kitasatospora sp. MMS16-BH015]|uniref:hypothetical protein n=1 Tax=Kitasatospora sp. MMS16-BH015 TaxID=2018025 RepID=UPI000CA3841E|nr:hypothetical protein [Kitasatospora sp. MMS16-BH015]AUG79901.1 hypothetical protein CFP65_5191 [Kitasatospora sp. MMS16-BH015]
MEQQKAIDWLAAAAPDPAACRREWAATGLALIPAGRRWDVLLVPRVLGELTALTGGPVYRSGDELGFLVPVGTAARWVGTGIRSAGHGTWLAVPHPRSVLHWRVPPDGSGRLVDPMLLELVLHEAAAKLHRGGPGAPGGAGGPGGPGRQPGGQSDDL